MPENKQAGISDIAIKKATGDTWSTWFTKLDRAGGRHSSHKEIAAMVKMIAPAVNAWWQQMIAGAYERARGLRKKHEMPDGFQISVSRTIPQSLEKLYVCWKLKRNRDRWYPDMPILITTANKNKNIRAKWTDDNSRIDVQFSKKTESKTLVVIQHSKISTARKAEILKKFWQQQMDAFKQYMSIC